VSSESDVTDRRQGKIDRQRAESFNRNAALYDAHRPGYPDDLYLELQQLTGVNENSVVIEIGAGSGIATEQMYHHWHATIYALEPGAALLAQAQKRVGHIPAIHLVHSSFEEYTTAVPCDLIAAATSFHWVEPAVKFARIGKLLKPGGFLAAWWSNFSRNDTPVFDAIRAIYAQYHPEPELNDDLRGLQGQRVAERRSEFERAPGLSFHAHREFHCTRSFTADAYIGLLRTFSTNACHPEEHMALFYERIAALIHAQGNRLDVPFMVNLELARKDVSPRRSGE